MMRAKIPYVLIGDVGFYQRAEIKDALALLRIASTPDDAQSNEAVRRVINVPARAFGPKTLEVLETEAEWRQVSLLRALEARNQALVQQDLLDGSPPFEEFGRIQARRESIWPCSFQRPVCESNCRWPNMHGAKTTVVGVRQDTAAT
jgi:superfamily I DNA/RNA helicase